jgi:hypothetical protein
VPRARNRICDEIMPHPGDLSIDTLNRQALANQR